MITPHAPMIAQHTQMHVGAMPSALGYGVHTFYLLIGTCELVDSSIL